MIFNYNIKTQGGSRHICILRLASDIREQQSRIDYPYFPVRELTSRLQSKILNMKNIALAKTTGKRFSGAACRYLIKFLLLK